MGMGLRGFWTGIRRKKGDSGGFGEDIRDSGAKIGRRAAGAPRHFRGEKSGPPWVDLPCPQTAGQKTPAGRLSRGMKA
jgi:hypothetical protein